VCLFAVPDIRNGPLRHPRATCLALPAAAARGKSFAMIYRIYVVISPAPLLLFALFFRYTATLEGWGAWAAGPMVLPVVAFSAGLGLYGLNLAVRAPSVRWRTALTASAVLAGAVAIWLPVQGLAHLFG
jgi:hypothetical protein